MPEPSANPTRVGPGVLFIAPLGTAEPTTPSGTLDVAWLGAGYTEKGSTWGIDLTVTRLYAEEAYEPLRILVTQRLAHMDFNLLELGPLNVSRALNGASTNTSSGGVTKYEPPDVGNETRCMLLWQSAAKDEIIIVRQALQTGNVTWPRTKTAWSTINCKFDAEIPATGLKAWVRYTVDSAFLST